MIYPYGNCSTVPSPQSLTLYYSNLLNYSTIVGGFIIGGVAPISLLDPLSINDPAILNQITLNQEASKYHHCLQYYCDHSPDMQTVQESNGVCTESDSITAVTSFIAEDPTVMSLVSHKVQDRVHVYSLTPVTEEVHNNRPTHKYIVSHGKSRNTTIPAIAITIPITSACTNITITSKTDILIYRAQQRDHFVNSTLANTTTKVNCLQQFEVVWIEPWIDSCKENSPNLQGTTIESTLDLTVYVAEAECNVTTGNRGFGYVGNIIHAVPPVRKWGSTFITDISHLQIPWHTQEELQASFHIVTAEEAKETNIVASIYIQGEKESVNSSKYKLQPTSNPVTIKVDQDHNIRMILLQSSSPVLVIYEVYGKVSGEPHFSTLLQPVEWFTQQQSLLLAHSLVPKSEMYYIAIVVQTDSESYDITKLQVQDRNYQQSVSILEYSPFHAAVTDLYSTGISNYVIVTVAVDSIALGSNDTYVVVKSADACTKLGASVVYYGEQSSYAHTNLYVIGKLCEEISRIKYSAYFLYYDVDESPVLQCPLQMRQHITSIIYVTISTIMGGLLVTIIVIASAILCIRSRRIVLPPGPPQEGKYTETKGIKQMRACILHSTAVVYHKILIWKPIDRLDRGGYGTIAY